MYFILTYILIIHLSFYAQKREMKDQNNNLHILL